MTKPLRFSRKHVVPIPDLVPWPHGPWARHCCVCNAFSGWDTTVTEADRRGWRLLRTVINDASLCPNCAAEPVMPPHELMLRAVLERPDDVTARLVYADALQDTGTYADEERAVFVRNMVAAAARNLPGPPATLYCQTGGALGWSHYWNAGALGYDEVVDTVNRVPGLLQRPVRIEFRDRFAPDPDRGRLVPDPDRGRLVAWEGGFVTAVALTLDEFTGCAAELFRAHPVTAVTLIDRAPYADTGRTDTFRGKPTWDWWLRVEHARYGFDRSTGSDGIAGGIFGELVAAHPDQTEVTPAGRNSDRPEYVEFDSLGAARAALSRACVAWGRAQAGLPPLPASFAAPADPTVPT